MILPADALHTSKSEQPKNKVRVVNLTKKKKQVWMTEDTEKLNDTKKENFLNYESLVTLGGGA